MVIRAQILALAALVRGKIAAMSTALASRLIRMSKAQAVVGSRMLATTTRKSVRGATSHVGKKDGKKESKIG